MRRAGDWKGMLVLGAALVLIPGLSAETWTLERALRRAQAEHPDAEMARARLEEAEARVAEARSGNLPRLDARLHYLQTTNPMQGFGLILSQGTFDDTINFNDPGQIDALTGSLEGRYRLYAGGARGARIRSAEAMVRSGEEGLSAAETALAEAVVKAYFGIRQADAIVRSLESGIEVLEENLRVSKVREEAGELIRTERLNLEVQLADLQRQLLERRNEAKLARFQFAFLLGMPPASEVSLAADDPSVEAIIPPAVLSSAQRPELKAARAALQAAGEQVEAARGGRLPTVDAYANWQADKGWRRDGDGTSWTAGLVMNLPVFDGHSTRARVAGALARQRNAAERLRKLELAFQIELEEARLAHELAEAQREVARKQVSQAQEAAELSRERFAAGTLLSTELIGVESRLTEARVQLALATANERIALAHLRRVAGHAILNGI